MNSHIKTVHVKIDPKDPDLSRIREVARGSREGKIVAFPTETVYGIGAPLSIRGVSERLSEIKGRDPKKPYALHIGELDMIDFLGIERGSIFKFFIREFWPGPLTIVVKNRRKQKIGLRFPQNRLATALISATGEPFIATSANLSDQPSPKTAEEVMAALDGKVDYILDGGPCEIGEDSTVLDLSDEKHPKILREGARAGDIKAALERVKTGKFTKRKILVVCTGNSCRSPMAEGWLKEELERKGMQDRVDVSSCGVGTRAGARATPEAVLVMKNREIDITEHRSRPCTREDVTDSDLIIAMSQQHANFIVGMVPSARPKIRVFNVLDPIGMTLPVYEDVMNLIEKRMKDVWKDITA